MSSQAERFLTFENTVPTSEDMGSYQLGRGTPGSWDMYHDDIVFLMTRVLHCEAEAPLLGVGYGPPYFADSIKDAFTDPRYFTHIVFDTSNGNVAGLILAGDYQLMYPRKKIRKKTAYEYGIAIRPDYQGLGLSGPLLDMLMADLIDHGYKRMELHARRDPNESKGYAKIMEKTVGTKEAGKILGRNIVTEKETKIFWEELGPQTRFMIQLDRYALSRGLL